jgi:gamma-glutamylcyclotransferase (GGCT)/AIG2-like uncharacterized protein YtfP
VASERTKTEWWRRAAWDGDLDGIVARINAALDAPPRDEAARCLRLFEAVDLCCTAFGSARAGGNAGETPALAVLLTKGIEEQSQAWLCRSPHVARLGGLEGAIRKDRPGDAGRGPSPEGLARLLSGARRAVAEGKRAPQASSRGEAGRRSEASLVAAQVLTDVFEALFDFPSRRLAVYGTLAPGAANHRVIADLGGSWTDGFVAGAVESVEGYPAFRWKQGARKIPVKVLSSERLPEHWRRIDRFEGETYRRILVPVRLRKGTAGVAHIYESRSRMGGPARL